MLLNNPQNYLVSTISDSPNSIFENLRIFEEANLKGIHFDLMDGLFVPRLGLYPELLYSIRQSTNLYIEVHTMLTYPSKYIAKIAQCGANRIILHLETIENVNKMIEYITNLGLEVGIAVNPLTDISRVIPLCEKIHSLMLMAIHPGVPKHPFLETTYSKIDKARAIIDTYNPILELQIDGGVTFSNHRELLNLGVDTLVCGSGTVFYPDNSVKSNIERLLTKTV